MRTLASLSALAALSLAWSPKAQAQACSLCRQPLTQAERSALLGGDGLATSAGSPSAYVGTAVDVLRYTGYADMGGEVGGIPDGLSATGVVLGASVGWLPNDRFALELAASGAAHYSDGLLLSDPMRTPSDRGVEEWGGGVGDMAATAIWSPELDWGGPTLAVSGRLGVPTGTSSLDYETPTGVDITGTGTWDAGLGLSAAKRWSKLLLNASGDYRYQVVATNPEWRPQTFLYSLVVSRYVGNSVLVSGGVVGSATWVDWMETWGRETKAKGSASWAFRPRLVGTAAVSWSPQVPGLQSMALLDVTTTAGLLALF